MICATTKACRLAAHPVNPPFSKIPTYKKLLSSPTTSRPFCAVTRSLGLEINRVAQQKFPARQALRHCSYLRDMCKKNADIPSGSVNAGADREVLPTNVKPLHYDLTLEPNFEKFSYEGTVVIEYVR